MNGRTTTTIRFVECVAHCVYVIYVLVRWLRLFLVAFASRWMGHVGAGNWCVERWEWGNAELKLNSIIVAFAVAFQFSVCRFPFSAFSFQFVFKYEIIAIIDLCIERAACELHYARLHLAPFCCTLWHFGQSSGSSNIYFVFASGQQEQQQEQQLPLNQIKSN